MIVENPASRLNSSQFQIRVAFDADGSSVALSIAATAKIVTNSVGTSLITKNEYVINTGDSTSSNAAINPVARPIDHRPMKKKIRTAEANPMANVVTASIGT